MEPLMRGFWALVFLLGLLAASTAGQEPEAAGVRAGGALRSSRPGAGQEPDLPSWPHPSNWRPFPRFSPPSAWINVRDFGAVGDATTDDTPAILAAIKTAQNVSNGNAAVVYFPATPTFYYLGTPLVLPDTANWLTLFFDGRLLIGNTIEAKGGYSFYGNGGAQVTAASRDHLALFAVKGAVDPIIDIKQVNSFRLENIQFPDSESSHGIVVENSADIMIKNVWMGTQPDNPAGIPLSIHGGFGIYVEGGGYSTNANGGPSIVMSDDDTATGCHTDGMMRVKGTFLAGHGIAIRPICGVLTSLDFEDILYESCLSPFLTIEAQNSFSNPIVAGIQIKDVNMADSGPEPGTSKFPPLVRVSGLERVWSVQIINSWSDAIVCKDGGPIADLEVMALGWCDILGQTSGYFISRYDGVIDTRIVLPPPVPTMGAKPALLMPKLSPGGLRHKRALPPASGPD
jgi:hypothetical protein